MSDYIETEDVSRINKGKVFFDANIWIFIYCEIANTNKTKVNKYSKVFKTLIKAKNPIVIDLTIISEFVNRYLRIAYNNHIHKNKLPKTFDYKRKYRKTSDFNEAWENVCNIVNYKILPYTEIINFEYDRKSLAALLDSANLDTDFNDNHIMNLCLKNKMYLLTDDGDFKKSGINIISANNIYWK
ncbi:MAG: hypothetical protein PF693_15775 [Spirochaetia bacterium]|jgi:predicted nucleic acid-binding protein|nr:hypothetical protein [Spirochaetia bacterium]